VARRFLFYSQGERENERIGDKGCETRDTHAKDSLSLARILRCALRIKHPSRRFICERVLFYCFPVERRRSLKVLLLLLGGAGAVPLFVLKSKTQVGETHLALSLSASQACCKYNGAALWPEMCDKLGKKCMPVIVILTLSCRGHVCCLKAVYPILPCPGCINLGFTS